MKAQIQSDETIILLRIFINYINNKISVKINLLTCKKKKKTYNSWNYKYYCIWFYSSKLRYTYIFLYK